MFFSKGNLKGKVVWITGGSSGIGESLAYLLARTGSKLIISGTNKERLDNVRRNCIAEGLHPVSFINTCQSKILIKLTCLLGISEDNILALNFDMKDFEVHPIMFKKIIDQFGKVMYQ